MHALARYADVGAAAVQTKWGVTKQKLAGMHEKRRVLDAANAQLTQQLVWSHGRYDPLYGRKAHPQMGLYRERWSETLEAGCSHCPECSGPTAYATSISDSRPQNQQRS